MDPTERSLTVSALKGDQQAFEMLIQTHSRLLYAHAYSILRRPQEAEDVVQESFLKAYNSKWRVRNPEKFPQWLVTIVRNRALDHLRKRRTDPLAGGAEEEAELAANEADKP